MSFLCKVMLPKEGEKVAMWKETVVHISIMSTNYTDDQQMA